MKNMQTTPCNLSFSCSPYVDKILLDPLTQWNQWIFFSATHHFPAPSPASNLPALLPSSSSPHSAWHTAAPWWWDHSRERGGHSAPACPCRQDRAVPTHPTEGWQQPPGQEHGPGLLSSKPQWCLSSQLSLHPQWIHFYWDIFPILGSWHSYCYTEYSTNSRGSSGLFLLSPKHDCTTAKQRELHSNVNPSGVYNCLNYVFLNNIREQATPLPLKVWSLAASFKTQKMGNYFGFCRLWIANPND